MIKYPYHKKTILGNITSEWARNSGQYGIIICQKGEKVAMEYALGGLEKMYLPPLTLITFQIKRK